MMLYVNGQDIGELVLGLIDDDVTLQRYDVGPERYLKTLEQFLEENDVRLDHVRGIIVVTGPGSATALRTSLSIVNTVHFSKRIPILALEKDPAKADEDVVTQDMAATLSPLKDDVFARPVYTSGPRITASKKDPLKRKIIS